MRKYGKNRKEFLGLRIPRQQKESIRRAASLCETTMTDYLVSLHQIAVQDRPDIRRQLNGAN
jgi:uncharacterized protein (DUF1778 family)